MLKKVGLLALMVTALSVAIASSADVWVTCTSDVASMSTIAYNVTYQVTTEAGGEAYPYGIRYGEVRLYSNIMPNGGSYRGWQLKGSTGTSSTTWDVVNQEHDIYVMWKGQVTEVDYSQGGAVVGAVDSGTPGPYYTP